MSTGYLTLIPLLALTAPTVADESPYQPFAGEPYAQGRAIWLANCEGCHGHGIAGAPTPMIREDWQHRLGLPRELLYRHAIDGYFGPDDTMMPARGGNDSLTDKEIHAAVDYMVRLASYYSTHTETKP